MTEGLYRCPRTGRALERRGEILETHDGSMRYFVTRGVPDFRLTPPPDAADEAELHAMVDLAEQSGWRSAVERIRPQLMPYVDDPSRAMFLDLLPLARDVRALEIGC